MSDAQGILDIYAPYIVHSFVTFENEVPAVDSFAQRIVHYAQRFPWLVCAVNDTIAGYVYASPHRDRAAYQWCCESSIYMHETFKGKGVGRILYQALFDLLKLQGMRHVYAGITLPNEGSVALHESLGFVRLATYDHIGYKLGEWKSVGWWALQLNALDPDPQPPTAYPALPDDAVTKICRNAEHAIKARIAPRR